MFYSAFMCLPVNRITQKLLTNLDEFICGLQCATGSRTDWFLWWSVPARYVRIRV